jgi:hypothetical protein
MFSVFVSYSTRDLEWARYLKQLLTDVQIVVFVAEYDVAPGQLLSAEISNCIDACDLFILLWSGHSQASAYVQSEVFHAKAQRRTILPIMLQRTLPLPLFLGDVKYLPFDQDPEEALHWLKEHVTQSAAEKASGNLVAVALMALLGWSVLKDK